MRLMNRSISHRCKYKCGCHRVNRGCWCRVTNQEQKTRILFIFTFAFVFTCHIPGVRRNLSSTSPSTFTTRLASFRFIWNKQSANQSPCFSLQIHSHGRGELLVSLCYQPAANRLTVVVLKARNLPKMDITGLSGWLAFFFFFFCILLSGLNIK